MDTNTVYILIIVIILVLIIIAFMLFGQRMKFKIKRILGMIQVSSGITSPILKIEGANFGSRKDGLKTLDETTLDIDRKKVEAEIEVASSDEIKDKTAIISGESPSLSQIDTDGGANVQGDVSTGSDFVGHDKHIGGDEVKGDKITYYNIGQIIQQSQEVSGLSEFEEPSPGTPPFKGLQFFDVGDAHLFFGREQLTSQLIAYLHQQRFLAIVGASGSGKSSLVRAGLVPTLQMGKPLLDRSRPPEGSERWPIHIITPTAHPLKALAASLTRDSESVTATATLMDDLARDARSLDLYVSRILSQGGSKTLATHDRLLLIVDQFEELFTLCREKHTRKLFIDNLLTASESGERTTVVLTLRADFYVHCSEFHDLRQALERHQKYIGSMNYSELRHAIEGPAQQNNWQFESGLIELMLDDVGDEPGALPLLSHALLETWKRRQGRMLTLAGYTVSGRVQGAIAQTAETVYTDSLTQQEQLMAKRIFLRLTELGEGAEDTRRRVEITELIAKPTDRASLEVVLTKLADARLITTDKGQVEVAHEALIRVWPRLRNWLEDNRERLRIHRRLTDAANEWKNTNYDNDGLFHGARLEQILEFKKENPDTLNELEQKFLAASRTAEYHKRVKWWVAAVSIALVLVTLAIIALFSANAESVARKIADTRRMEAEKQTTIAQSRQLATEAVSSIDRNQDWELSLLLALEAAKLMRSLDPPNLVEADNILRRAFASAPLAILRYPAPITSIAFSPDGTLLALTSDDGTARVLNFVNKNEPHELLSIKHNKPIKQMMFSPDSHRLVTVSEDHVVRLTDIIKKERLVEFRTVDSISVITFNTSGSRLAVASSDGIVSLINGITGKELTRVVQSGPITTAVFNQAGTSLVTAGKDGLVHLINALTGKELSVLHHTNEVHSAIFSPDGKYVATATSRTMEPDMSLMFTILFTKGEQGQEILAKSFPRVSYLWDAESSAQKYKLSHNDDVWNIKEAGTDLSNTIWQRGENSLLESSFLSDPLRPFLSFSPDSRKLAAVDYGNWVYLTNTMQGDNPIILKHDGLILSLAISPDWKRMATVAKDTAGSERAIYLWNIDSSTVIARIKSSSSGSVNVIDRIVFNPQGTRLAIANPDGIIHLLDAVSGVTLGEFRYGKRPTDIRFDAAGVMLAIAEGAKYYTIRGEPVDADDDSAVHLLDANTGRELSSLTHGGAVNALAFGAAGDVLATASQDGTVRLWNPSFGVEPFVMHHSGYVEASFNVDGTRLFTKSSDGVLHLIDITSNTELLTLRRTENITISSDIQQAEFSLNGKQLAVVNNDHSISIINAATGVELAKLPSSEPISNVTYSPNGKHLASASYTEGIAKLWDLDKKSQLARIEFPKQTSIEFIYSRNGTRLAIIARETHPDNTYFVLLDTTTISIIRSTQYQDSILSVIFNQQGNRLVVIESSGAIHLVNTESGQILSETTTDYENPSVQFSPDGTKLAMLRNDGRTVELTDVLTGQATVSWRNEFTKSTEIIFNPKEEQLAVVNRSEAVPYVELEQKPSTLLTKTMETNLVIINTKTGSEIYKAQYNNDLVKSIKYNSLGSRLLVLSIKGEARLLDQFAHNEFITIHNASLAEFTPGGDRAIIASGTNIHLLDANTGRIISVLPIREKIDRVDFSDDDKLIILIGKNAIFLLSTNGVELGIIRNDEASQYFTVSISPDGKRLLTTDENATVRLYRVYSDDLFELACNTLTRNLTEDEWKQLMGNRSYETTCPPTLTQQPKYQQRGTRFASPLDSPISLPLTPVMSQATPTP